MIEVIDKLIPLLNSAGEGVFVLALFIVLESYFTSILTFGGFMGVVWGGCKLVQKIQGANDVANAVWLALGGQNRRSDWEARHIRQVTERIEELQAAARK